MRVSSLQQGGGVTLRIHKETWKGSDDFTSEGLMFKVFDTGIGIETAQFETIFQMFRQADGSTSQDFGGGRLGLPISRQLARLMGGDLTLDSELGKGSTFSLTMLPETLVTERVVSKSDDSGSFFFVDNETSYEKTFQNEKSVID